MSLFNLVKYIDNNANDVVFYGHFPKYVTKVVKHTFLHNSIAVYRGTDKHLKLSWHVKLIKRIITLS